MSLISQFTRKSIRFKGLAAFLFAVLIVFSISACGDKAEEKQSSAGLSAPAGEGKDLPEGHPTMTDEKLFTRMSNQDHSKLKSAKPVKVTDAIKAKYKSVSLQVTDNSKGTKDVIKVVIGTKKALADGFSIKVDTFLPDYSIYEDYIASKTEVLNNPAVMVELYKGDEVVSSGWVFEMMAQYNSYSHIRYAVALLPAE